MAEKKLSPFDFVGSFASRKDVMGDDPANEKAYLPFIINRQLSYFPDTILLANEMNASSRLPNRLQYDFLRLTVRPQKRFAKWVKATTEEDVEVIAAYYKMSKQQARDAAKVLGSKAITHMRLVLARGGMSKDK